MVVISKNHPALKPLVYWRGPCCVVLDPNILIDLIQNHQLDQLHQIRGYKFHVPNHVWDEIKRHAQKIQVYKAVRDGWLGEIEITDVNELELYVQYRVRFGKGESACLAIGVARSWLISSSEKAIKKEAFSRLGASAFLDVLKLLQTSSKNKKCWSYQSTHEKNSPVPKICQV